MPPKGRPSFKEFFPYATLVQKRLASMYVPEGVASGDIDTTVALDVSYSKEKAYAAAVVYSAAKGKVVEEQTGEYGVHFPYIPGYLYMREAPPVLRVLSLVETQYDLILIDAHGRLHPRGAGLATIIGVLTERPTVGIAKSLLVGEVKGKGLVKPILLRGVEEGLYVKDGKAYYVSPGNLISLKEIRAWLATRDYRYPEELVRADALSKRLRGTSEAAGPS